MTIRLDFPKGHRRALRAWCQWELGDPDWADQIIDLMETFDPENVVESLLEDEGETIESVLTDQHIGRR